MNPVRNANYRDTLARDRRRRFVFKMVISLVVVGAVLSGAVYLLFFSKALDIRDISINGLETVDSSSVMADVRTAIESKKFKYLEPQKDILLFNAEKIKEKLLTDLPILKKVDIKKNFRHGLVLNLVERKPSGVWCFSDGHGLTPLTTSCHYFDEDGVLWGEAIKSSGFLFLTINDARTVDGSPYSSIDKSFLDSIKTAVDKLKSINIIVKEATIPDNSAGDFNLSVGGGYDLKFNVDSDIASQVEILKIFLNDKAGDPNFKPQYIDLRIAGRVYYK